MVIRVCRFLKNIVGFLMALHNTCDGVYRAHKKKIIELYEKILRCIMDFEKNKNDIFLLHYIFHYKIIFQSLLVLYLGTRRLDSNLVAIIPLICPGIVSLDNFDIS